MKKLILLTVICLYSFSGFCVTWTISATGAQMTFNPATLTVGTGDSINFSLASVHNAVEVSQATWNANGTTALPGGFSVPFGGGMARPPQLSAGIHYYVCQAHASSGMKGTITVCSATLNLKFFVQAYYNR